MTNRDTRRRPTPQGSGGTSRTANGFDLLERLYDAPLVIFSTAYDEYAVRAYDVHAFDYLLKPIR
jgi:DNA-binding LytR/AlgR family response regulator